MPTRSEILQAHKDALAQADEERRKALSILAAEEAAHRKARAKRQAAGTTKMRSFRVPDERWERAKAIAEAQSTTVSALINEFLNSNLRTDNVVFMDGTLYLTAVGKGDLECVFESDPEYLLRSGDLLATQKPALA